MLKLKEGNCLNWKCKVSALQCWIKMTWKAHSAAHLQTNPALWGFPLQQRLSHHCAGMLSFALKAPALDVRISHESASPWFIAVLSWPSRVSSGTLSEAVASAATSMEIPDLQTGPSAKLPHVPLNCAWPWPLEAGGGNLVVIWKHTFLPIYSLSDWTATGRWGSFSFSVQGLRYSHSAGTKTWFTDILSLEIWQLNGLRTQDEGTEPEPACT